MESILFITVNIEYDLEKKSLKLILSFNFVYKFDLKFEKRKERK